jgi:hypothetical protein
VSSRTVAINARCLLCAEGEQRVVVVASLPMHHHSEKDAVAEAYAMVLLADGGQVTQKEIAVGFRCSERTVRRHQERHADGGMTALAKPMSSRDPQWTPWLGFGSVGVTRRF